MVGDLFHYGHVNFIKEIHDKYKNPGDKIYIGVHNDETIKSYKRKPILTMDERINVISSCKYIDKIIPNAPLNITNNYIQEHKIDLVFIPDNRTEEEIKLMIPGIYDKGIVRKIKYTDTISTTDIIKRIKERDDLN